MNSHNSPELQVDIAIIGGGNAGLSLARKLEGCRAVVVEPQTPAARNYSWSFWHHHQHQEPFAAAVRGRWHQWKIVDQHSEVVHNSDHYAYLSVNACDYLTQCEGELASTVELVRAAASDVKAAGRGATFTAGGRSYRAQYAYDSRQTTPAEGALKQHFIGWEIKTKTAIKEPHIATLMDFRVDQSRGLHFIYALPFSSHRLLVESTMISTTLEESAWYTAAIERWLALQGIEVDELIRVERGVIAMSEQPTSAHLPAKIGIAGGAVRLSSGYAFTLIQQQVNQLYAGISRGDYTVPTVVTAKLAWMDALFNRVLLANPPLGVAMMVNTAKALDGNSFARFMLGKASLWEWCRVILAMPKRAFLRELVRC